MKKITALLFVFIFNTPNLFSQSFNKKLNKDSLIQEILKNLSDNRKDEFLKIYESGSEGEKEFLLLMFSMPRSSKNELIRNIDSNYEKVDHLKNEYSKLIPKGYEIYIEFNPGNIVVMTKESIDLRIIKTENRETVVSQEWNLEYNSTKLNEMLKTINWNNQTLLLIKKLLREANCISIENGEVTNVGFARSGMGKYFYKLLSKDLTPEQIKQYNNGCTYIFYKRNIVLEYGGGATGAYCFPD